MSAFERLSSIIDELCEVGADKDKVSELKTKLSNGNKYLKTEYKAHCTAAESQCADHCRRFSLSDPNDPDFQSQCSHSSHKLACSRCEELKTAMDDIRTTITSHSSNLYNTEQRDDLIYDFEMSKNKIFAWKCHILRGINQEYAKQDALRNLDSNSALIVTDWAMKFVQLRYREKQSDWYAKRGMSWHVSSVVTRDSKTEKIIVLSYAHLLDSCSQDWYAVASILENLLENVKVHFPEVKTVFLRSDEAGCYKSNNLVAAVKDIGHRVGITVEGYDYSEPQQGKDICDRVLCPMKAAIRRYCAEGHDILNASDMRNALKERPVKGTTAAVGILDTSSQNLKVNKIKYFSELHNFRYEKTGLRMWKAYDVGPGKLISWDSFYVTHQETTNISLQEGEEFFKFSETRELQTKKQEKGQSSESRASLFVCPEEHCNSNFDSFSELELHIEVGMHDPLPTTNETFFDTLRRDWADKFSNIDIYQPGGTVQDCADASHLSSLAASSPLGMGWALGKPRKGAVRFTQNVRSYLTAKFELGERTRRKADPDQVALEMRNARNEQNERLFEREEWLSKTQIAGFFSRLAARGQKSSGQEAAIEPETDDDRADIEAEIRESDRCDLIHEINEQFGLKHPIIYDTYDLCDYYRKEKINAFNVAMLKTILSNFEVPYRAKDRKAELVRLLCGVIMECQCCL